MIPSLLLGLRRGLDFGATSWRPRQAEAGCRDEVRGQGRLSPSHSTCSIVRLCDDFINPCSPATSRSQGRLRHRYHGSFIHDSVKSPARVCVCVRLFLVSHSNMPGRGWARTSDDDSCWGAPTFRVWLLVSIIVATRGSVLFCVLIRSGRSCNAATA